MALKNYHSHYNIVQLKSPNEAKKWGKIGEYFTPWPFTHKSTGTGSFGYLVQGEDYTKSFHEYAIYVAYADGYDKMDLPPYITYLKGSTAASTRYAVNDGSDAHVADEYGTSLMAFRVDMFGNLSGVWFRTTNLVEGYKIFAKRDISRVLGMNFNLACPPSPEKGLSPEAILQEIRSELDKAKRQGVGVEDWFGSAIGIKRDYTKWRTLYLCLSKDEHGADYPIGMKISGACFVSDNYELMNKYFRYVSTEFFLSAGKPLAVVWDLDVNKSIIDEDGNVLVRGLYMIDIIPSPKSFKDLYDLGWLIVRNSHDERLAFVDNEGFFIGDWVDDIYYNYSERVAFTNYGLCVCIKNNPNCCSGDNDTLYNFMTTDGEYLFDEWLARIKFLCNVSRYSSANAKFDGYRYCILRNANEECAIYDTKERKYVFPFNPRVGLIWFNSHCYFTDGFDTSQMAYFSSNKDGNYYYINSLGEVYDECGNLSDDW